MSLLKIHLLVFVPMLQLLYCCCTARVLFNSEEVRVGIVRLVGFRMAGPLERTRTNAAPFVALSRNGETRTTAAVAWIMDASTSKAKVQAAAA